MNRDLRILADFVKTIPGPRIPRDVYAVLTRLSKPHKARSLSPGRMKPSREERDAEYAQIRFEVDLRAEGRCELCGLSAIEMHHLIGGSSRRSSESVSTVILLCLGCHRAWHRGDLDLYRACLEWAQRRGFAESVRAIRQRITKATRAGARS